MNQCNTSGTPNTVLPHDRKFDEVSFRSGDVIQWLQIIKKTAAGQRGV